MVLSIVIGLVGGAIAIFAVRFFELLQKNDAASLADGIKIMEDDVLG